MDWVKGTARLTGRQPAELETGYAAAAPQRDKQMQPDTQHQKQSAANAPDQPGSRSHATSEQLPQAHHQRTHRLCNFR